MTNPKLLPAIALLKDNWYFKRSRTGIFLSNRDENGPNMNIAVLINLGKEPALVALIESKPGNQTAVLAMWEKQRALLAQSKEIDTPADSNVDEFVQYWKAKKHFASLSEPTAEDMIEAIRQVDESTALARFVQMVLHTPPTES